jgi:fibronectin type 3 domain-containing protein
VPSVDTVGLSAVVAPEGGAADLYWNPVLSGATPAQTIIGYKVYYGDKSGQPYAFSKKDITATTVRLDNLQNGKTYYAAITAVYKNGAESVYSAEVSFKPQKTAAPQSPTNIKAEAGRERIVLPITLELSTTASSASISLSGLGAGANSRIIREVSSFKLDYGKNISANSASVSFTADEMLNKNKSMMLHDLATGTPYYLTLSSIGKIASTSVKAKFILNEGKDPEISFISPVNDQEGFSLALRILNNSINVSWAANTDDTIKYELYYGVASGQYGSTPQVINGINNVRASFFVNNVLSTYHVNVKAVDKYGNKSPFLQTPGGDVIDVSVTPLN